MRKLYLRHTQSYDEKTKTWCATGFDKHGKDFGVGAGATETQAIQALRLYVLESLLGSATDNVDGRTDLARVMTHPTYNFLPFTAYDLFPVVLRLTRVRASLTQDQMANRLAISQQGYQKFERIGVNPTLRTIKDLEHSLQTTLVNLV